MVLAPQVRVALKDQMELLGQMVPLVRHQRWVRLEQVLQGSQEKLEYQDRLDGLEQWDQQVQLARKLEREQLAVQEVLEIPGFLDRLEQRGQQDCQVLRDCVAQADWLGHKVHLDQRVRLELPGHRAQQGLLEVVMPVVPV